MVFKLVRRAVAAASAILILASGAMTGVAAAADAPVNTVLPVISGTARDGSTLTASTGSWSGTQPLSYAYRWLRCDALGESCVDVDGATGETYTLSSADVGATMRVAVTASNAAGDSSAVSDATGIVTETAPG